MSLLDRLRSLLHRDPWVAEDGYEYLELARLEYTNCAFTTGFVRGHPVDTLYLLVEREGQRVIRLLLRPDEAAAVIQVVSSALWNEAVKDVE